MTINQRRRILYLVVLWTLYSIPYIVVIILFILLSKGRLGYVPSFQDLENPKNSLASEVYSDDGVLLGKFFLENRTYVEFEELSANVVNALIATEDIRFYRHSGIDAKGMGRVLIKSILMGRRSSGGGSTITQQLAKNLYPRDTTYYNWRVRRLIHLGINKFKEWNTAVKLERNYTKNEILVMYLNTVPFGSNSFGIKSAAKTFFNTSPDSLNLGEAALLIGVLKAQTKYNPVLNPERSLWRRNIVLNQMRKYGFITDDQFDSLSVLPIVLDYKVQDHTRGLATHFRQYLQMTIGAQKPVRENYFMYSFYQRDSIEWENNPLYGWVNKNFKPDGSPYSLFRDGLRIHTTIHSKLQQYAEEALNEYLSGYLQETFYNEKIGKKNAPFSEELDQELIDGIMQRSLRNTERYRKLRRVGISQDSIMRAFNTPVPMKVFSWDGDIDTIMSPIDSIIYYKYILRAGLMSMDPSSGFVRAYVGGIDFRYFKYDHVKIGKRQAGSTFKPFLYTLAMQEGYSPCYRVPNVSQTFVDRDSTWTPRSPGGTAFLGKMVTLKWGLAHSVNNVSAWLIKQFPPQAIIDDVVKKMGFKSYIMPVNSIMFGVSDVSLYEMVGGFNTFSNKGVYIEPIFVTRIEDKDGNVISTFQPNQNEAISARTAYLMMNLLEGVVDGGTAIRLRYTYNFTAEIGGKTGTTQNHSDGWFMGLVPKLTTGIWVGAEDRSIHFDELALGQGANMALPIWALYMQRVYNDSTLYITQEDIFEKPPGFNIQIDCQVNDFSTNYLDDELWEEDFK
ncbi:MAG: penicillin-binding protein [Bacteroides sp. SM23_62_1]|nr:MAG: penicillin-binding protein [Bacteroides sp. SM23_62_1]